MKKYVLKAINLILVLVLAGSPLLWPSPQTGPDAWEQRCNSLQPADKVMDAIGVKPGMMVGEVGAGRGRFAVKMAKRVGTTGKIYANDIDARELEYLKHRCKRDHITNIETILGTDDLDIRSLISVGFPDETPGPIKRKRVQDVYREV